MKDLLLCATASLYLCVTAFAVLASSDPLWISRYEHTNSYAPVTAIAVDNNGNSFVAGLGYNGPKRVFITIAYSAGGIPLWTNRYQGPNSNQSYADEPRAITVDSAGRVFVTGASPSVSGDWDYATVAYSNLGTPLWTNRYNNSTANSIDEPFAISASSTNVFVTGRSDQSLPFISPENFDYATVAYSSLNGDQLWVRRYNGLGNNEDYPVAMLVATNANVYVTGYSSRGAPPWDEYATVAYSNNGTPIWTNRFGVQLFAQYSLKPTDLKIDGENNIWVTGYTKDDQGFIIYPTIKYSIGGMPLLTNIYAGPWNSDDGPSDVSIDSIGNVYASSYYSSSSNYYKGTVKFSTLSTSSWTNLNDTDVTTTRVDRYGNVYVTGSRYNGINNDFSTLAYSSSGVPLWTNLYVGPSNGEDVAGPLAIGPDGNVTLTGNSVGASGMAGFATIRYAAASPTAPAIIATNTAFGFTNGKFGFQISAFSGASVEIQGSSNLQSWASLQTNVVGSTNLYFLDHQSTNIKTRFYRARLLP